ncbi:type II toxin-antitoxin system prevent-host-death family antitoxin [Sphingomonas sp. SUN019]|uniref:type II toxin-antitoxin system Phd/YefM family antitoxin n=1 Tax=Sphingomonas sp. SUN019 TaxID=2937788 RepID=UPI0021644319|nr:type II toxin-antitoxin system prevent-host-death family antitoxin [Sphingomonas sp. SUN019]UVO50794.1 type II toxin-antitoxin system prevent-host-death family antitoxin [Sphingomonas sp. SUN019]
MTVTVTTHEAKTQLSKLIARALAGEDIIIANRTTPQVRLVPVLAEPEPKRGFGSMKGKFKFDESFFDPLPDEELDAWEGR